MPLGLIRDERVTGLELGSLCRDEPRALLEAGHPLPLIILPHRSQMTETFLRMETLRMMGRGRRNIGVRMPEMTNRSDQVRVLMALAVPLHQVGVEERRMDFPVKSKSPLLVVTRAMLMM